MNLEEFADGSLRVTTDPWILIGDGPSRVALPAGEVFGGPARDLEVSAQELAGMFGETERRRLAAAQAAATTALLYAGSAAPSGFSLLGSPGLAFDATFADAPGETALTVVIAAVLAGQLAKDRALRVAEKDSDPRRVVAASLFGGSGLAQLHTFAGRPVALLYGPAAYAPDDWTGPAVHMDYLREQTRAWINANAVRVDALAELAFVRGEVDAATIEQALSGHGPGAPVGRLAEDHPLRRPTPIPLAAIEAVADYWSAVLRRTLERTAPHRADQGSADGAEDARRVEVFRATLAEQIALRLERRENRGDRRIQTVLYDDESRTVYAVAVHYETDPVIADALTAAGIYPGTLHMLLTSVELDHDTVTEYRAKGQGRTASILWRATGDQQMLAST
jgi:hypothetical protein